MWVRWIYELPYQDAAKRAVRLLGLLDRRAVLSVRVVEDSSGFNHDLEVRVTRSRRDLDSTWLRAGRVWPGVEEDYVALLLLVAVEEEHDPEPKGRRDLSPAEIRERVAEVRARGGGRPAPWFQAMQTQQEGTSPR